MLIEDEHKPSVLSSRCRILKDASLWTARQTIGDGRPACMGNTIQPQNKDVFT
jgi:hypothetical protein